MLSGKLTAMTNQGVGTPSTRRANLGHYAPSISSVFDFGSSEVTDLEQALPGHVGRPPGPAASPQKALPALDLLLPSRGAADPPWAKASVAQGLFILLMGFSRQEY